MPKGGFEDFTSSCSLCFTKPEIEQSFREYQEERVRGFGRPKQIILAVSLIMTITLVYRARLHYIQGEMDKFWALFYTLLVGNGSVAIEFAIHCIPRLRYLRCIAMTVGSYFTSIYYAAHVLPVPGMNPG